MIRLQEQGAVLHATLERPETRNAINFEIMAQLEKLLDRLENDSSIRVFTLRGSQGAFVSGGDLREFHQLTSEQEAMDMGRRMLTILKRIEALDCWTVCFTNGAVYGGGWEMMLSFDVRISLPDTVFGFTQGRFYLPPGWGGLERLVQTVGPDQAKWLLAGQRVINAERAAALGLVQEIVETEDDFDRLLQPMTMNDRVYIRHVKLFSNPEQNGSMENSEDNGRAYGAKMEAELHSFAHFWTHSEHINRIETFLASHKDPDK